MAGPMEFRRLEGLVVHAKPSGSGEPNLPRWTSDRQGLSPELARGRSRLPGQGRRVLGRRRFGAPTISRLREDHGSAPDEAGVLETLFAGQEQVSEIPGVGSVLVEEYPDPEGVGLDLRLPRPARPARLPRRWPGRRPPGWAGGSAGT